MVNYIFKHIDLFSLFEIVVSLSC